jgi:hypothetical protein
MGHLRIYIVYREFAQLLPLALRSLEPGNDTPSPGSGTTHAPTHGILEGITLFSPSHRLLYVLKAPEEQKYSLLASGFHLGPTMLSFVFLFPSF